ncbi:MAG: DUF1565 domain-containing protein [Spirochaetes bacterium]|nr:DUF1565 domain-containing protein [Spirochaetota bacterium]MBU1080779.1 DUF1565 domain-containing protein [Spirochaetota bacterium]
MIRKSAIPGPGAVRVRLAVGLLACAVVAPFVAGLCASCSDALFEEMARIVRAANEPAVSPASGSTITAHEAIAVAFPAAMLPGSVALGGDLGPSFEGAAWSTDGKTLVLNPGYLAAWTAGDGKSLSITVSEDGQTASYSFSFTIFEGVCVSGPANSVNPGAAGNPGTRLKPLDIVQAGIDRARVTYPSGSVSVRIAGGRYASALADDFSAIAAMREGVSLYGGYSPDFSVRDLVTYETKLDDERSAGGSDGDPLRCVEFGTGISSVTVFDGFTVYAPTGGYNAAIFITDSSPSIANCVVAGKGRDATSTPTTISGIEVLSGSPVIEDCTIFKTWDWTGGNTIAANSYGVYSWNPSEVTIQDNVISGGYGANTYGVYSSGAGDTVTRNAIVAGSVGSSTTGSSHGICCDTAPTIVSDNSIDSSSADAARKAYSSYGVFILGPSPVRIAGNTIRCSVNVNGGKSFAIYENNTASDPAAVGSNKFSSYFGETGATNRGYYWDDNSAEIDDLSTNVTLSGAVTATLASFGNTVFTE